VGGGAGVTGSPPAEYDVRLHPTSAREYRRLQRPLRERVRNAIDALGSDPRPAGTVKLAGRDDYRIRVWDHRIVYAVDDAERIVIVARIARRREVYRR